MQMEHGFSSSYRFVSSPQQFSQNALKNKLSSQTRIHTMNCTRYVHMCNVYVIFLSKVVLCCTVVKSFGCHRFINFKIIPHLLKYPL